MAEAMLCDQSDTSDAVQSIEESIVVFVEKNKDNEKIKELYEAWENVCHSLQIDITYVRLQLDGWFQKCYHSWNEMQRLSSDVSHEMVQEMKEKLFEEFMKQIEEISKEKDNFIVKLKVDTARKEIMRNYSHSQEEWIDKAVQCVEQENQLMANFKKVKLEEEKAEANQKIERDIAQAKSLEKDISKCMEKMKNEVTNWNQHYKKKEECQQNLDRLKGFLRSIPKNGVVSEEKQLEVTIKECGVHMSQADKQINFNHKEIVSKFGELYALLHVIVTELVLGVDKWKQEFKFQYAELVAAPNLMRIAPWCAQVGQLIYNIINSNLPSWDNILTTLEWENKELVEFQQMFYDLLTYFLQSTFLVTEQESCIIKVDKKHLPKFVVRILAAENFPERNESITAWIAFEDDINMCCHDNSLDLVAMQKKIKERDILLLSNAMKFENGKKKEKCEASFTTLRFKSKFSRQGIQTGKQVHEEKSRIIFTTTIYGQEYWTMSLPLVVTTGANQGCLSQASVMWQCFSTDVYSVPITECSPLPWYEVADMLQAKVQVLCPTRKLSTENINHLKRRLFGGADVPDEELVTLKKFCFDKLEKTDDNQPLTFSFWKWFIGIYNLLDKYLLNFWKDGLIMGFISKEDAKEKLKKCKNGRSGTFLLRFSDQNITDSQGVKSVFGHLTACVLIITEEIDGHKKKKICDMDVAGHKKLKEKNLANILKETQELKSGKIYQYLYPGDRTREETFDTYCDKEAVVPGYTGTRDAFVVHLDQQLAALEISCGKHRRSPSIDSGIDTSSPLSCVYKSSGATNTAAKVKKQRVSVKHPTIAKMLQQGHSSQMEEKSEYSSQQIEVNSDLSASPPYNLFTSPPYSGQSPYQLESSPAPSGTTPGYAPAASPEVSTQSQETLSLSLPANLSGFQQLESGQESPKCSSLPTVIDEAIPVTRKSAKRNVLPISCDSCYHSASSGTTYKASQRSSDGTAYMVTEERPAQMPCISFEAGSTDVTVPTLSGHSSLESNNSSLSAVSGNQSGEEFFIHVTDIKPTEPVTSTVSDQQEIFICQPPNPELMQIMTLLNTLPPELLKIIQNHLDQTVAPEVTQGAVQMATELDTASVGLVVTTSGTPVLTSSGSLTDAFNFSPREIAEGQEMNSGTIDTSVFATMETSSGGMPT